MGTVMAEVASVEREIREENFKDHTALFTPLIGARLAIQHLLWAKPGTGLYRIEYMIRANVLFVTGDVGHAVYRWGNRISWEFLAVCHADYFAEKCEASEHGRGYPDWNERVARARVAQFLKDSPEEREQFESQYGDTALFRRAAWHDWLSVYGADVFGDPSEWADVGVVVSPRCRAHLIGIQMALERRSG